MQFSLYSVAAAVLSAGAASAYPSQGLEARQAIGQPFSIDVKYDPTYDTAGQSMATVACSDGANGLMNKWPTFGNVKHFDEPHKGWGVAAVPAVGGWNSPACGRCYSITPKNGGSKAWVIAVDAGRGSLNVGFNLMDKWLIPGRARELGHYQATVQEITCPPEWRR